MRLLAVAPLDGVGLPLDLVRRGGERLFKKGRRRHELIVLAPLRSPILTARCSTSARSALARAASALVSAASFPCSCRPAAGRGSLCLWVLERRGKRGES